MSGFFVLAAAWSILTPGSPAVETTPFPGEIRFGSRPCVAGYGRDFYFEWADSIWRAPVAGGQAVRITGAGTIESCPLVSPDGEHLAFLSDRDGGFKIFVMDLGTRETRRVSCNTEETGISAWSPDGSFIIGGAVRDASAEWRARRIAFFGLDGTETYPFKNVVAFDAALSPDGSILAFSRRGEDPYRKRRTGKSPQDAEIWLRRMPDGPFEKLETASESALFPRWRPDGRAIYYIGRMPGSEATEIRERVLGGGDRRIASFGNDSEINPVKDSVHEFSVSRDGKKMVARAGTMFWRIDPTEDSPVPHRIIVGIAGEPPQTPGAKRRLYDKAWNNGDGEGDVSFCSDGMEAAFAAGGGLYAIDAENRVPRLVADVPCARVKECAFSPDGSRLWHLVDFGDRSEVRAAFKCDPASGWAANQAFSNVVVCATDDLLKSLAVSPSGDRISWSDTLGSITFADAATGAALSKSPAKCGVKRCAWSPDGLYLAAELLDANNNDDIWILAADGSREPYNVSRSWRWDGMPAWSPDGKIVAWSGTRLDGHGEEICYVYANPADEAADAARAAGVQPAAEGNGIVFDGLFRRVRRTGIEGYAPFFSYDSRTIGYVTKSGTATIRVPDRMEGSVFTELRGRCAKWYEKDNRLAWSVDGRPAHLDDVFDFKIYREEDAAAYRELAFRTAWARLRDRFCDRTMRGVDWGLVRYRYLPYAKRAPTSSVFMRVIDMMTGELGASHLGCWRSDEAFREWPETPRRHNWNAVSGHLGAIFEPGTRRVARVIASSPAEGVLFPGDEIVSIDGERPGEGRPLEALLLKSEGETVSVAVAGREGSPARLKLSNYAAMRKLVAKEETASLREAVAAATGGRVGYVAVRQMHDTDYRDFESDMYAECWDKEAVVIDLRGNSGGYVADRMLALLCGPDHARTVSPSGESGYLFGYWPQPVFSKPVAVVVDEAVQSNAEIFAHAIKNLKRGLVVGRRTSGSVIATNDLPLLDVGTFRDAFWGCFTPDGRDMENNGVVPDIEVDATPADEESGAEPAVAAAAAALLERLPASPRAFVPRYSN